MDTIQEKARKAFELGASPEEIRSLMHSPGQVNRVNAVLPVSGEPLTGTAPQQELTPVSYPSTPAVQPDIPSSVQDEVTAFNNWTPYGDMSVQQEVDAFNSWIPGPDFSPLQGAQEQAARPGPFVSGVKRGAYHLGAEWANAAAFVTGAAGIPEFEQSWLQTADELNKAAENLFPRYIKSLKDAEGFGETTLWAYETLAEQVPFVFSLLLPGGVAGKVGGKVAGTAAAAASDLVTMTGESAGTAYGTEEGIEGYRGNVALNGALKAGLDFLPISIVLGKMGALPVFEKWFIKQAMDKGFIRRSGENVATLIATEVPTEVAQEMLDISLEHTITELEEQGYSPEEVDRLKETAAAAATFGIFGIPAAVFHPKNVDTSGLEDEVPPPSGPQSSITQPRLPAPEGPRALLPAPWSLGQPGFVGPLIPEGMEIVPIIGEETMVSPKSGEAKTPLSLPAPLATEPLVPIAKHWTVGEKIAERISILVDGETRALSQRDLDDAEALRIEALVPEAQRTPGQLFLLHQARKRRLEALRESMPPKGGFVGPLTERGLQSPVRVPAEVEATPRAAKLEGLIQRLRDDERNYRQKDGQLKVAIEKKISRIQEQIEALAPAPEVGEEVSLQVEEPEAEVTPVPKEVEPVSESAPAVLATPPQAVDEAPPAAVPTLSERENQILGRLQEKEMIEGLSDGEYAVMEKLLAKAEGEQAAPRQRASDAEIDSLTGEATEAASGDYISTVRKSTLAEVIDTWNGERTKGLPVAKIKDAIRSMEKVLGIEAQVVELRDLPINYIVATGALDSEGMYVQFSDGRRVVYLIADNLDSVRAAQKAYLHEVVGHYGVRSLLNEAELAALQRAGGYKTLEDLEEAIAVAAENSNYNPSFLARVKAFFRKALRRLGIDLKLKDYEIEAILRATRAALIGRVIDNNSPDLSAPSVRASRVVDLEQKRLQQYYKELKERVRKGGQEMGIRAASWIEENNAPIYPIGSTYRTPSGNKVEVLSDPFMMRSDTEPRLSVDITTSGEQYKSTISYSAFSTFSPFSGPVSILYKKVGADNGAQLDKEISDWSGLWEAGVFGRWTYTPLQMNRRFGRFAKEFHYYLAEVEKWWKTKIDRMSVADPIARRWNGLNESQSGRLAKALFEVSIESDEKGRKLTAQEEADVLRRLELDDESKAVYNEVKNSLQETIREMFLSLRYNAVREHIGDKDRARIFLEKWDQVRGDGAKELDLFVEYSIPGEILEGSTLSKTLRDLDADMKKYNNRNYFPRMRFGRNAVTMRTLRDGVKFEGKEFKKGQVVYFETHENAQAQKEAAKELIQEYGRDNFAVQMTQLKETEFSFVGMPPGLLNTITKELKLKEKQITELKELFNKISPGRAFLRHLIQRKGVKGFSHDAKRVYATYMLNAANHIARVKHYKDMQDYLEQLELRQKGYDPEATLAARRADPKAPPVLDPQVNRNAVGMLANYADRHYRYIMNPGNDFAKLRALGFMWYLGFNAKSAVVNLSQVPLVTYPYLAERFGDGRAASAIAFAMPAAGKFLKGKTKSGLSPEMLEVIKKLTESGLLDESIATELAGFSESTVLERLIPRTEIGRFYNGLTYASAFMFRIAEKYNRHVTAIASAKLVFDAAGSSGVIDATTIEQAYRAAKDSIQSTQFEYAKWNRPEFMRGKKSVLFLFWQYMQHASFLAFGGQGQGTAIRFWLLLAMAAGLQGLPFAENLMDLIDFTSTQAKKLTGSSDPYTDVRTSLRKLLNSFTNDAEFTDGIMHGSSRYFGLGPLHMLEAIGVPVPNVDVSSSLGLGRVVPGLEDLLGPVRSPEEKFGRSVVEVMGPVMGVPYALWRSANDTNPDSWKKWERAMPTAVKSLSRAARWAARGEESFRGGGQVIDFPPDDVDARLQQLTQALGFAPTRLGQRYELNAAQHHAQQWYSLRRAMLLEDYSYAKMNRNNEMLADVNKEIRVFNHTIPDRKLAITSDTKTRSLSERQRRAKQRTGGIPGAKMYRGLYREHAEIFPSESP